MSQSIAIIGGGNLGASIAEGLISSGFCKPGDLVITRRNTAPLAAFEQQGVRITHDNHEAVAAAEWVVLAVKPFQVKQVVSGLKKDFTERHKIISVVTGVWIDDIKALLEVSIPVFRAMPNTAIAIRESITCISSQDAGEQDITWVRALFDQLGKSVIIDEKLMDAATVLGACGIAFALRFIRASTQGGIQIGFDARTAALIAEQTVKGAAGLLLQKGTHPEAEIDKVTTPKGCTIAGLNEMEHQGFSSSLIKGITTSFEAI